MRYSDSENKGPSGRTGVRTPGRTASAGASSETPPSLPRALTVRQGAEYLQVHPRTLHRWIASGRVPAVRIGRIVRIMEDDLRDLMQERRR